MNTENLIALIGILFGFLATCITASVTIYKANAKLKQEVSELGKEVRKNREHDKEQYLAILRLTVMSEEMPTAERIVAGKKYIAEGGNGAVKEFFEKFVEEHTI